MKLPKIPQQIVSVVLLFSFVFCAFITARHFFVPQSFGLYGHYRANAVEEIRKKPTKYAGYETCIDCHEDIYNLKAKSYHKNISCEVCHGPAQAHTEDPTGVKPEIPHERSQCAICHNYNPARPTGFPQIIASQHNPGKFCTQCHQPHNPTVPHGTVVKKAFLDAGLEADLIWKDLIENEYIDSNGAVQPKFSGVKKYSDMVTSETFAPQKKEIYTIVGQAPHTPGDCSACHREIWNQKMVSHHASLQCTTCHTVPPEHFINPRGFEVKKPDTKEFCGKCHDRKADSPVEVPRVDIKTHGGRYLCWECHYPHNPEANL